MENSATLMPKIRATLQTDRPSEEKLQLICQLLRDAIPHYDWVGFYIVDPRSTRELILGPYVGAPTEHTRIPFGRGICGQAAALAQTFIVQDVSQENNYLACSPDVRSEIVVPIWWKGEIIGELDIDSHTLAPFTEADRELLDHICALVAATVRAVQTDLTKEVL